MPFDTVSDVRSWLSEEPTLAEAKDALVEEQENDDRTTAKRAINSYIEDNAPEPIEEETEAEEETSEETNNETEVHSVTVGVDGDRVEVESLPPEGTKRYRVVRPFKAFFSGDEVYLDPSDYDTRALLNGGQIEHNPLSED